MGYRMVKWKCSVCGGTNRESGKHGTMPEGTKAMRTCWKGCRNDEANGYPPKPTLQTVQPYSTAAPRARKPKRRRSYFR